MATSSDTTPPSPPPSINQFLDYKYNPTTEPYIKLHKQYLNEINFILAQPSIGVCHKCHIDGIKAKYISILKKLIK